MYKCYGPTGVIKLSFATLPSSPPFNPNPNLSPQFFRLRREPSPNSSFHFLKSASVPRDSEAEGVISLSAFVKCRRERIRGFEGFGASESAAAAVVNDASGDGEGSTSDGEDDSVELAEGFSGTIQGRSTVSFTASRAADTQRSEHQVN
jgi:hypothetical protein